MPIHCSSVEVLIATVSEIHHGGRGGHRGKASGSRENRFRHNDPYDSAGFIRRSRSMIAFSRASMRSARSTTGMSIILLSIENEARPGRPIAIQTRSDGLHAGHRKKLTAGPAGTITAIGRRFWPPFTLGAAAGSTRTKSSLRGRSPRRLPLLRPTSLTKDLHVPVTLFAIALRPAGVTLSRASVIKRSGVARLCHLRIVKVFN